MLASVVLSRTRACAEELREQLLLDGRRAARGDDEKDTAKDHSTRHRDSSFSC
jgi:hypothetical protein